jgi:hypothetical protein
MFGTSGMPSEHDHVFYNTQTIIDQLGCKLGRAEDKAQVFLGILVCLRGQYHDHFDVAGRRRGSKDFTILVPTCYRCQSQPY